MVPFVMGRAELAWVVIQWTPRVRCRVRRVVCLRLGLMLVLVQVGLVRRGVICLRSPLHVHL